MNGGRRSLVLAALLLTFAGCDRLRAELKARAQDAAAPVAVTEGPSAEGGVVAPVATAAAAGGSPSEARRSAWLTTPLTGRDNDAAAFRLVQITPDPQSGFRLFVKNQFKLACGLTFDDSGRPFEAKGCKGEWRAKDPVIRFSCKEQNGAEVCRGAYTLVSPDGFSTSGLLEIVRAAPGAKAAAPVDASVCPRVCQKLATCKRFYFANDKLETCAAACQRELAEVDVAGRAVVSSQLSCIIEESRPCQDLVTCGSVRVAPNR